VRKYEIVFLTPDGQAGTRGATQALRDDQAVRSASQTLRQDARFAAVEIWEGERLVRRLERADVARRRSDQPPEGDTEPGA
jgi:hypothetical protein